MKFKEAEKKGDHWVTSDTFICNDWFPYFRGMTVYLSTVLKFWIMIGLQCLSCHRIHKHMNKIPKTGYRGWDIPCRKPQNPHIKIYTHKPFLPFTYPAKILAREENTAQRLQSTPSSPTRSNPQCSFQKLQGCGHWGWGHQPAMLQVQSSRRTKTLSRAQVSIQKPSLPPTMAQQRQPRIQSPAEH